MQEGDEQVLRQKVLVARELVQIAVLFDRLSLMGAALWADKPEDLRLVGVVDELEPGILKRGHGAWHVGEDLDGLV